MINLTSLRSLIANLPHMPLEIHHSHEICITSWTIAPETEAMHSTHMLVQFSRMLKFPVSYDAHIMIRLQLSGEGHMGGQLAAPLPPSPPPE